MLYNLKVGQNVLIQLTQCTHTQTTSRFSQVSISQQPILTQNPLTFFFAVSLMRFVVLVHDSIQANCKET